MTAEPLTCPYCNALIPDAGGATVGQRVPCPRCGEAFTLKQPRPRISAELQTAPANAPALTGVDFDVERRLRMRRANHRMATAILAVMLLGAIISLTFALYSQPERRANDTR